MIREINGVPEYYYAVDYSISKRVENGYEQRVVHGFLPKRDSGVDTNYTVEDSFTVFYKTKQIEECIWGKPKWTLRTLSKAAIVGGISVIVITGILTFGTLLTTFAGAYLGD